MDTKIFLNDLTEFFGTEMEGFSGVRADTDEIPDSGEFEIYNKTYRYWESVELAIEDAKERVKEDLKREPELFSKDWLIQYIEISDMDRNLIAQDAAISRMDRMEGLDLGKELQEKIEDNPEEYDIDPEFYDDVESDPNYDSIYDVNLDKLEEEKREEFTDDIYEKLSYPINYFVDEEGIYTIEELLAQPFIRIDVEAAAEGAVAVDGFEHFLDSYDGRSDELDSGIVIIRTN